MCWAFGTVLTAGFAAVPSTTVPYDHPPRPRLRLRLHYHDRAGRSVAPRAATAGGPSSQPPTTNRQRHSGRFLLLGGTKYSSGCVPHPCADGHRMRMVVCAELPVPPCSSRAAQSRGSAPATESWCLGAVTPWLPRSKLFDGSWISLLPYVQVLYIRPPASYGWFLHRMHEKRWVVCAEQCCDVLHSALRQGLLLPVRWSPSHGFARTNR